MIDVKSFKICYSAFFFYLSVLRNLLISYFCGVIRQGGQRGCLIRVVKERERRNCSAFKTKSSLWGICLVRSCLISKCFDKERILYVLFLKWLILFIYLCQVAACGLTADQGSNPGPLDWQHRV